jgi:hypothetical protein
MNPDSDIEDYEEPVLEDDDDYGVLPEGRPTLEYKNLDSIIIQEFREYEDLYRLRHDLFHEFVCESRNVPMGEKPVKEFFSDIQHHKRYSMICNQTPDSITISGRVINIIEVAVSYSNYTYTRKFNKYYLLKEVLTECGYHVNLDIIIMPLGATTDGIINFCNDHQFNLALYLECMIKVEHVDQKIQRVESEHPEWVSARINDIRTIPKLNVTKHDILNLYRASDRKPFCSEDDLMNFIESKEDPNLTNDDIRLINYAADMGLVIKDLELVQSETLDTSKFWKAHDDMNKDLPSCPQGGTFISISPLPLLLPINSIKVRDTSSDDELVLSLKKQLINCDDLYLVSLANMVIKPSDKEIKDMRKIGIERVQTECIGKLKLSQDVKWQVALEGPGRKHYIKRSNPSEEHIRKQREKTMYITGSTLNLDSLGEIIWFLSRKNKTSDLLTPTGNVWTYLKFVQNVYQEVNINFLRKELKKNHIIKPTIYDGVFIVIHQGPPYLTGAKQSMVWFKLIGYIKDICVDEFTSSWIFKEVQSIGNGLWSTNWLSSDPHRLSHYIRIYDKVLMAYLTYLHGSRIDNNSDQSLLGSYNDDSTDTLGLISLIYLENKRVTSKTLQDVRYVIMETVSHHQYWNNLLEKFNDPIRSPLQLYIIRKIVEYIEKAQFNFIRRVIKNSKFGKVTGDISGLDIKKSGADIKIPRLLTRSINGNNDVSFQQILCEMYFTMLFNKDQDDPTHSSFQVLEKILKGEDNLENIKKTTGLHVGLSKDEFTDFKVLVNSKKKSNQFSSRAVIIAAKLQNLSKSNRMKGPSAHSVANTSSIVNRSIDDYATYKSSATFPNQHHQSKKVGFMQNPRRRCIEGVYNLQRDGLFTSIDVFNKTKDEETEFQVFKKNQIGGVREILILSISTRIRINILESYSRVLCNFDEREMLTHGPQKNSRFVGIQQNLKLNSKESIIMHYNFDKKRWGPSFMPIQFMYMFKPFQNSMGDFFLAFLHLLIKHTNKRCYYPDHLIKAWINNVDREHTRDPLLTDKKKLFLQNKQLYFINESNMGQGILHYTSSLFHLCVVSLRDEIYKKMCELKRIEPCEMDELVSSDDSYTAQSITDPKLLTTHVDLFLRAQSIVERLLNVETSKSKSSISPIIGEFNSLFISNLTTFPTLIKFTLASVDAFSTDSFTHIVKESFNSMRMIVENGGSIELYDIAYQLNKRYAENMYHTTDGDWNDPSGIFNTPRELIPYQFGVFPIAPSLCLLMMGPEAHNYRIVSMINKGLLNDKEKIVKLFKSAHTIVSENIGQYGSDLSGNSDIMIGSSSIIAMTRTNKKLKAIQKRCEVNGQEIKSILLRDPLFPLRKPIDLNESIIKTRMKLLQSSAVDAMKVTSGSLYFGRVSATATAKCFKSLHNSEGLQTFKECLFDYYNMDREYITEDLSLFYDNSKDYDLISGIGCKPLNMTIRNNLETRMYKKLFLNDLKAGLVNPISVTLGHFWNPNKLRDDVSNSVIRDWIQIKKHIPIISESLRQTLENLDPIEEKAVTKLLLMLMRLTGTDQSTLKGFIFGESSKNFEVSAEILYKENSFPFMTSHEYSSIGNSLSTSTRVDKMLLLYNEFLLRSYCKLPVEELSLDYDLDAMLHYCGNKNTPPAHKKRLFAMALYFNMIDDLNDWTTRIGQAVEYWLKPQKFINGEWVGDCEMIGYYSDAKSRMVYYNGFLRINIDPSQSDTKNFVLLRHMIKAFSPKSPINDVELRKLLGQGNFCVIKNRLLPCKEGMGFKLIMSTIPHVRPTCNTMVISDGYFDLLDSNKQRFMRCQLGLFSIDKYEMRDNIKDFEINNFTFFKMVQMRAFSPNFNLMMFTEHELIGFLDDNEVKPIFDKNFSDQFRNMTKMYRSGKSDTKMDYMTFDEDDLEIDDLYQQILNQDDAEPFNLAELTSEDIMSSYIDELFNSEIFTRHIVGKIEKQPSKINLILWNRIILIKSFILLRLWTGKTFIGKRGINAMINMGVSAEIIIACINVYFILKTRLGNVDSPSRVYFNDCIPYMAKFDVKDEEWFEYFI